MTLFRNKFRVESARLAGFDYRHPGYYFVTICTKSRICFFGDISDNHMNLSECGDLAHQYWVEIPQHCPMVELDEFVVMPNHVHGIIRILDPNGDNAGFPYPFLPTGNVPCNGGNVPCNGGNVPCNGGNGPFNGGNVPCIGGNVPCNGGNGPDIVNHKLAINPLESNSDTDSETSGKCISSSNPDFMDEPDDITGQEFDFDWMLLPLSEMKINQFMSEISPKKGSLSAIIRSYKSAVSRDCHKIHRNFDWHIRFHDRIIRNQSELYRIRYYIRKNPLKWNNDRFYG